MRHIAGVKNVADHLSRVHHDDDVGQLSSFISVFDKAALFDEIKRAQQACTEDWYVKLAQSAVTPASTSADTTAQNQNQIKND